MAESMNKTKIDMTMLIMKSRVFAEILAREVDLELTATLPILSEVVVVELASLTYYVYPVFFAQSRLGL